MPISRRELFGSLPLLFQTTPVARPHFVLLLADNWAAEPGHGANTPCFERLAKEGIRFVNAFSPNPSCAPARASLLTGRVSHQLEGAANLHGTFPGKFATYPTELMKRAGYQTGYEQKGWGPGELPKSERLENPAGETQFRSFAGFLASTSVRRPFSFWFGSHDPHRPWTRGQKPDRAARLKKVRAPGYLPNHPEVREDLVDYGYEVEQFDSDCAAIVKQLEAKGILEDCVIVMTSDNGWQFPRGLANVYDAGTKVPMALWWGKNVSSFEGIERGQVRTEFVTTVDLAPTFFEACFLKPLPEMTGQSLLGLLKGKPQSDRDCVFLERERHANVRRGDLTYPVRAIRTADYLYVWNLEPERWPAGDPEAYFAVGPYGDVDDSRTKRLLLSKKIEPYFTLGFGKRPAEELYDLKRDPDQTRNRAKELPAVCRQMRERLLDWMKRTADPRAGGPTDFFDRQPYFGPPIDRSGGRGK